MKVNIDPRLTAMSGEEINDERDFNMEAHHLLCRLQEKTAEVLGFESHSEMNFRDISIVMYDTEHERIHGVGLYWSYKGRHFGNKMVDGEITDWYEIFTKWKEDEKKIICHEIDIDGNVLAYYTASDEHSFKYDAKTDELLQKNYRIKDGNIETLDPRILADLERIKFRYVFNIAFWGIKPYGRIVELFVDTPNLRNDHCKMKYNDSIKVNRACDVPGPGNMFKRSDDE